jgi:hypothetical protein
MDVGRALTSEQVKAATPALQIQVYRGSVPVWQIEADLVFGVAPPAGAWWLVVFDTSDQLSAVCRGETAGEELPNAKAFAGTDEKLGLSWTINASDELLGMLADPEIDLTVFIQPSVRTGALGGVAIANFIHPGYFETAPATQFARANGPVLSLLQGGYVDEDDVAADLDWHHLPASDIRGRAANRARTANHREPRRMSRDLWRKSKPDFR